MRVNGGVRAHSAAESLDLRNESLSIDKDIIDLPVKDFGDPTQQAALESQGQGRSGWLCDCLARLGHIYALDGLARDAAVGGIQPDGGREPKDDRSVNNNSAILLDVAVYLPDG